MKTPEQIIELIREDAPCVYDILHEECYPRLRGNYPQSDTNYTWDDYFKKEGLARPTPEQLLTVLRDYSGDNYDTHHWAGRYDQMRIDKDHTIDKVIDTAYIVHKGIELYLTTEKLVPRHKVISIAQEYFGNSSNFNKFIHSL